MLMTVSYCMGKRQGGRMITGRELPVEDGRREIERIYTKVRVLVVDATMPLFATRCVPSSLV